MHGQQSGVGVAESSGLITGWNHEGREVGMNIQTNRKTDKQTSKQTNKQTNKQSNKREGRREEQSQTKHCTHIAVLHVVLFPVLPTQPCVAICRDTSHAEYFHPLYCSCGGGLGTRLQQVCYRKMAGIFFICLIAEL